MSIKCMNYVWQQSTTEGADRLMLLALADSCNDDGEWSPGVERLAEKCNVKERAAQYTMRRLEEVGELEVVVNGGFATRTGNTNKYIMKRYLSFYTHQGVQPTAPLGVQPTAPNTSVLTISTNTKDIPLAAQEIPPTPTAKTNHRNAKATADPRVRELLAAYVEVRGKNGINYAQEGMAAKKILSDFGEEDYEDLVKNTYGWLKRDEFWKYKVVGLATIFKNIEEYKRFRNKGGSGNGNGQYNFEPTNIPEWDDTQPINF